MASSTSTHAPTHTHTQDQSIGYMYSVCMSHGGEYIFGSDVFTSKAKAKQFLEYITSANPSEFSFELYKHKSISEPLPFNRTHLLLDEPPVSTEYDYHYRTDSHESCKADFSHMSIRKYGKGFLVSVSDSHALYGEKYMMGGWWMPRHKAWFFKINVARTLVNFNITGMERYRDLLLGSNSAHDIKAIDEDEDEDYMPPTEDPVECAEEYESDGEFDAGDDGASDYSVLTTTEGFRVARGDKPYEELSDCKLMVYGRGYLLVPSKSCEYYGQKYLGDGFWNESQRGWFFRSRFLDDLLDSGIELKRSPSRLRRM